MILSIQAQINAQLKSPDKRKINHWRQTSAFKCEH
jgi:hypothetical protein